MSEGNSIKQEPLDVVSKQYLIAKIAQMQAEILDLQKKIHEAAHKIEATHRESEYWQNINARQQ